MATTFNKVTGIFRLGKDPEVRYSPAGLAVANFSGASDYSRKVNDEWQKETEWTRFVAFSKSAERIGEQLQKGSLVYIEGRLKTNKWQDKDGNDRYSTDVIVNVINFLDGYQKKSYDDDGGRQQQRSQQPGSSPEDDDIPF